MKIEPLTLASLAPVQRPTKRAELNGHTLRRGDGYWGMGRGQGVHTPSSNSPSQKFQSTGVALILVPHWKCQSLGSVLENIKIHHKTRQHPSCGCHGLGGVISIMGILIIRDWDLQMVPFLPPFPFAKVKIFYSYIYNYKTPLDSEMKQNMNNLIKSTRICLAFKNLPRPWNEN